MLNLFDSESDEIDIIQRERFSTRVYLVILLISISTITTYLILLREMATHIISKPSQSQYEEFVTSDLNALQCPCSYMSVPHSQFITIKTSFHQVCSSDFVRDVWIDNLFYRDWSIQLQRSDIRNHGAAAFGLLSTLCTLSQTTIKNATDQFLDEVFISAQALSEFQFQSQMNVTTRQFSINTLTRFSRGLQLVRDMTHGNTFISAYLLNWFWWVKPSNRPRTLSTDAVTFNNSCSCGTRSDCVKSGGIYPPLIGDQLFSMTGWNVGCSSLETLLRSTFQCLYNQTCIDILQSHFLDENQVYKVVNVTSMNSSLPSRFQTNTYIVDIIDELFVEEWTININYSLFYQQCSPTHCSFIIRKSNTFLYILTQILAFYGGLTVSLRFIIPYIIQLASRIRIYVTRATTNLFA